MEDEKLSERLSPIYTGINKNLTSTVAASNSTISVSDTKGLYKGDFIQIKDEIARIVDVPTSTTLDVIRGQLGTDSKAYSVGEVLRKISPIPIELRRPSIIRASGHTFEYLGFGLVTTQQLFLRDRIEFSQREKLSTLRQDPLLVVLPSILE